MSETRMAGGEMDVVVAKALWSFDDTGWPTNEAEWKWWGIDDDGARYVRCPQFSTSIADAWTVAEKMCSLGWGGCVDWDERGRGHVKLWHKQADLATEWTTAESVPLAICAASLDAMGLYP